MAEIDKGATPECLGPETREEVRQIVKILALVRQEHSFRNAFIQELAKEVPWWKTVIVSYLLFEQTYEITLHSHWYWAAGSRSSTINVPEAFYREAVAQCLSTNDIIWANMTKEQCLQA